MPDVGAAVTHPETVGERQRAGAGLRAKAAMASPSGGLTADEAFRIGQARHRARVKT